MNKTALVFFAALCAGGCEKGTTTSGTAALPTIYWKIEKVGIHAASSPSNDGFVRLFDDGRVVSLVEAPPSRHVLAMVRSTDGKWKEIVPPSTETGLEITWYDDDANFGGRFLNSPSHGFAMVNGVEHRFFGPDASVRGRFPDGSLSIDSNVDGYIFLQKWVLGPTGQDILDIHNYYHQDYSKNRVFTRLAANGNVFLTGYDNATQFASDPVVFNGQDNRPVYDPVVNVDFGLVTMDRTRGTLFGIKKVFPPCGRAPMTRPLVTGAGRSRSMAPVTLYM